MLDKTIRLLRKNCYNRTILKKRGGNKMRKIIGRTLQAVVAIGILCCFLIMTVGYTGFKEKLEVVPLEQKVASIQVDEDYVPLKQIDEDFLKAIVAVEDRRFFEHGALDLISLVRAVITNLESGKIVEGGSTITQQLAKNMYFSGEKKIMRKVEEMFMAYHIEQNYAKQDILELYVNMIYFGDGYYGIKEASEGYFNKAPGDLDFNEATLLAGLPQSPNRYALSTNYELAKKRQTQVIASLSD